MRTAPIWRRYLRLLGDDFAGDVDDELRFHLETRIDALVAEGMSREAARAQAEHEFGEMAKIREEMNEMGRARQRRKGRARWWEAAGQDLRFAGRGLRKNPAFAAISILTLGLGIGGTTAIFSVVEGVLLRPLAYSEPDRLVQVWQIGENGGRTQFSRQNHQDVRERSRSFEALAAYSPGLTPVSSGDGEVSRVSVAEVSDEFFEVLDAAPALGRWMAPEEVASGAPVAVVSAEFWRMQLGGGERLEDRAVRIGDRLHTVVGVMPQTADFPWGTGAWIPRDPNRTEYRTGHNYRIVGRLAPGVSLETAEGELSAIARELRGMYGDDTWMMDAAVVPLREQLVGGVRPVLFLLLGAAGFLLLVACANVVNLLLARAATRRAEIAVRQAVGAGKGRLVRQFLTEALLLSVLGGVLGVILARFGVAALLALEPGRLPRVEEVGLDASVLAFAIAVSFATAATIGLVTAIRAADGDIHNALSESVSSRIGGVGSHRARHGLMALQIVMTCVLLVGAGMLIRSFLRLTAVDPGYRTTGTVVIDAYLPSGDGNDVAEVAARARDDLLARLSVLPGVSRVGVTSSFPTSGGGSNGTFLILTEPEEIASLDDFARLIEDPSRLGQAEYRVASGDYFRAMGIPLLRGRPFDERDAPESPHAAVISESLAERRWSGEDPIGKIIQYGNMDRDLRPYTIVGVVGDIREAGLDAEPLPTFYGNALQRSRSLVGLFSLVLEVGGNPAPVLSAARVAAAEAVPDVPVRIRTVEEILGASLAQRRFSLILLSTFALTALALAVAGVYGVISYLVAQRRRELGIRLTLGATRSDIIGHVIGPGMAVVAGGVLIGIIGAFAATRLLESLLYGITPTDPPTFLAVAFLLISVSLVATWVPAIRAARTDPMIALRE
ncbi:MAG: FtsX-like permease family protein [Gemmatimonas sp.]|nr:FtsX-like permease family protein [Gemmatimonas sp.]